MSRISSCRLPIGVFRSLGGRALCCALPFFVGACQTKESSSQLPPGGGAGSSGGGDNCKATGADEKFSFFVTSLTQLRVLSGNEYGFGGDLRYGGAENGLEGADAICQEMARRVCHGDKTWHAFLSTTTQDAIDRIGPGPWFDHSGALVAESVIGLVEGSRPSGGCCDGGMFDETGLFHDGNVNGDDHDTLTGSGSDARYDETSSTCDDWTNTEATGKPIVGHSWPRSGRSGKEWLSEHRAGGCRPGVNTMSEDSSYAFSVGAGGGYGAFYCFAL